MKNIFSTENVQASDIVLLRTSAIFAAMSEAALDRFYRNNNLPTNRNALAFLKNAGVNLAKVVDFMKKHHTAEHMDEENEIEEAIFLVGGHLAAGTVTPKDLEEFLETKAKNHESNGTGSHH